MTEVASRDQPPKLREYVMVLYWRGDPDEKTGTSADVFAGHLRYLNEQTALGRIVLSGPFGDDEELRGISIYHATDVDEVRALVATDPAVIHRHLRAEVRPWWTTPGVTIAP